MLNSAISTSRCGITSSVSQKLCIRFWQFNRASVGPKCITRWENTNIEIRNPKQYQNPNALNSKQKRTCTQ